MLSITASFFIYLAVFILAATLMVYGGRKKGRGGFLFAGLIMVALFGAFRVNVGTDFGAYLSGFNLISGLSIQSFVNDYGEIYEPGIYILSQVSILFGGHSQVFFGLFSFLTALFMYLGIKRYKILNPWLAILLYMLILFPSSFNIMRQLLAVSIFFYASSFIFDRKILKYILLVALAALFHKSAVILLPLYFIGRFIKKDSEINTRSAIILAASVGFAAVLGPYIIAATLNLSVFEKYDKYQIDSNEATGVVLLLKAAILGLVAMLYKYIKQYPYVAFFLVMSVIELVVAFVARSSVDISRFSLYFSIFPLILLSYVPLAFRGKSKIVILSSIVIYGVAVFYMTYLIAGGSDIFPYGYSFKGVQ